MGKTLVNIYANVINFIKNTTIFYENMLKFVYNLRVQTFILYAKKLWDTILLAIGVYQKRKGNGALQSQKIKELAYFDLF